MKCESSHWFVQWNSWKVTLADIVGNTGISVKKQKQNENINTHFSVTEHN